MVALRARTDVPTHNFQHFVFWMVFLWLQFLTAWFSKKSGNKQVNTSLPLLCSLNQILASFLVDVGSGFEVFTHTIYGIFDIGSFITASGDIHLFIPCPMIALQPNVA